MNNIIFKNDSRFLGKATSIFQKYYLLIIVLVFISSSIFIGFVYYRYVFSPVQIEPGAQDGKVRYKEDAYNAILKNIDKREKRFTESKGKVFRNIFSEKSGFENK